jgi:hypothetical protein
MDSRRETDTIVGLVSECCLQDTEEAFGTRNADQHAAELAEQLVPLVYLDTLLVWGDRVEDGQEAFDPVRWELDREADRVNEPTKDDMAGGPSGITFLAFLDGSWLLSVRRIRSFERYENYV